LGRARDISKAFEVLVEVTVGVSFVVLFLDEDIAGVECHKISWRPKRPKFFQCKRLCNRLCHGVLTELGRYRGLTARELTGTTFDESDNEELYLL